MSQKPKTAKSAMPPAVTNASRRDDSYDGIAADAAANDGRAGVADGDRELGARLRAIRSERKLTLKDLAARTNMSIGMLSQIERGVSSPSMRSLRQLCIALGIDGAALFVSNASPCASAASQVSSEFAVLAAQRKALRLADSGVTKYRVTPANCASLEAFLIELEPGAASDPSLSVQTGDKIAYVLEGRLRVAIDEVVLTLEPGDTYGFTGSRKYRWENAWDKKTVFMVVNSNHFYV
ncbi:MAG: helix-turn-helix domain-containing protein [Bordetella sp.]|uniref:helix-turn-helix domain-containing protein n=1 Tax=Bordetella sp. TaxID=28081 RepID=UPI003F7BE953